jgi:hypothetical protein
MTQRESNVPGSATAAHAAPDSLRSKLILQAADRPSLWEEIFRTVSPAQRTELLALAGRQGFLYAHQVPDEPNGKKSGLEDLGRTQHLTELLRGPCPHLPPLRPEAAVPWDQELDLLQREAVARALGTPDVCVIAGLPGTGKSRVVAEILTQAAVRGLRVLFVAPHAAGIDHVLQQIVHRDVVFPVRCLEAGAKPESLPESLRPLTVVERLRMVREAMQGALRGKEAAEHRCQRRRRQEAVWPELRDFATAAEEVERRQRELQQRLADIPGEVAAEAAGRASDPTALNFAAELADEERRRQETLAEINAAQGEVEQTRTESTTSLAALNKEAAKLRPLALAKKQRRWWSLAWWRATSSVLGHLLDLEERIAAAQDAVAAATDEAQVLHAKRQALEEDHQVALDRIVTGESRRRQGMVLDEQTALAQEAKLLRDKWQARLTGLEAELHPEALTAAAVAAARLRWQEHLQHDEEACKFAGQWAGFLQESSESIAGRLPALANLLAATVPALAADKHFAGDTFDLLVLEDAHRVGEADFLKLARRARRWVLVGEPAWDYLVRLPAAAASQRAGGCFQRLWQHCLCDPRRLPYAWVRDGDRLCCRLRPLAAGQRSLLESERVADFLDIELRILTIPRQAPVLAEVVFPASMSLAQAKAYICKELQELAIQAGGYNGCWLEDAERVIFHVGHAAADSAIVQLDDGVREMLSLAGTSTDGSVAPHTCRIEFAKTAGWNRDRAVAWLNARLRLHDPGRAIFLQVPYRMQPDLRAIVADVLFADTLDAQLAHPSPVEAARISRPGNNGHACPLVFVPVPALPRKEAHSGTKPLPRDAAGLELDLAAARTRDRLPADVRSDLPTRGFVNYQEARSLVRRLEKIVCEPAAGHQAIAVVALHAAQTELLRGLIRRSATISRSSIPVEVGTPSAFSHREFSLVLVSLTRSQAHRAVALADDLSQLILALTRAQRQLILFGDPGTLSRRGQWQGRLDNLDEAAAGHEAKVVNHLVRYLQGRGQLAQAFHLCDDGC